MAINNPVVADNDIIQNIALAIQGKDHGGKMEFPEMPGRIENIPSGGTLIPKTIAENGVYNASSDNADGYDIVTVGVPEKNTLDEYFAGTLEVANIPSTTKIPNSFFMEKKRLVTIIMPNVTKIGDFSFSGCRNLFLTSLSTNVTHIGNYAFELCTSFPYLDFSEFIRIPTVSQNSFMSTYFPFYFRDQQQLDEWAAATNWSTYADRFQIKPSGVI